MAPGYWRCCLVCRRVLEVIEEGASATEEPFKVQCRGSCCRVLPPAWFLPSVSQTLVPREMWTETSVCANCTLERAREVVVCGQCQKEKRRSEVCAAVEGSKEYVCYC